MTDTTQDVHTLAMFRENAPEWIEHLKTTHRPLTLTVDGNASEVAQEAQSYRANLRQLLYGDKPHIYRVIFRIDRKTAVVNLAHIQHGARKPLMPSNQP